METPVRSAERSTGTGAARRPAAPARGRPVGRRDRDRGLAAPVPEATATLAVAAAVAEALQGPGRPLDPATRSEMESRFGHDFGRVRVHDDARSAELVEAMGAVAFTAGQDVYFAPGQYQPGSPSGRRTLAHELAHTIQHGHHLPPLPAILARAAVSEPGQTLEGEADAAADRVAAGQPVAPGTLSVATPRAAGLIARRAAPLLGRPVGPDVRDPVRMLDALALVVLHNLQTDPDDRAGRVRHQLTRLERRTRDDVLRRLRARLTAAQWARLTTALAQQPLPGTEIVTAEASLETAAVAEPEAEEIEAAEPAEPVAEEVRGAQAGTQAGEAGPAAEEAGDRAGVEADAGPRALPGTEAATAGGAPVGPAAEVPDPAGLAGPEPVAEEAPPALPQVDAAAAERAAGEAGGGGAPAAAAGPAAAGEGGAAQEGAGAAPAPEGGAGAAAAPAAAAPGDELAGPETIEEEEAAALDEEAPGPDEEAGAGAGPGDEEPAAAGLEAFDALAPETAAGPEEDTGAAPPAEGPEPSAEPAGEPPEAAEADLGGAEPAPAEETGTSDSGGGEPAGGDGEGATGMAGEVSAGGAGEEPAGGAAAGSAATTAAATAASGPPATLSAATTEAEAPGQGTAGQAAMDGTGPAGEPAGEPVPAPAEAEAGCSSAGGAGATEAPPEAAGGEGGGVCAAPGGSPIPEPAASPVPDVSGSSPEQALAAVGGLPPARLQSALGGVSAAASAEVAGQREELATTPPELERPSGVPATRDASQRPPSRPALPDPLAPTQVGRTPAGNPVPTPEPEPLPPPPASPVEAVREPQLPGEAKLTAEQAEQMAEAVDDLPATDPALHVTAGEAPRLVLTEEADPIRAVEQRQRFDENIGAAAAEGRRDVRAKLGEDLEGQPHVPKETLRARIEAVPAAGAAAAGRAGGRAAAAGGAGTPGGGPEGGPGGEGAAAADPDTLSIVAQEQRGEQIRAAVAAAGTEMGAQRQTHATKTTEAQTKSQTAIDELVQENATEQTAARSGVQQDVWNQRRDWAKEQQATVSTAREGADKAAADGATEIGRQRRTARQQAEGHIATGNTEIRTARREGERESAVQRKKAKEEGSGGGFFSWVASKVKSFFNRIKNAIRRAFDWARKKVREAIDRAKRLANDAIEFAKKAVVGAIRAIGAAVIAVGDIALAAFPETRKRFRAAIQRRVDQAEAYVNKLADELKESVQRALDALGEALDKALGLLERGLLAAVDAVSNVVVGAIEAAGAFINALVDWASIIKDVAAGPGRWISNLASAAINGVRFCLWAVFRRDVKQWFNEKLDEVLGLGPAIWDILRRGCISVARIGAMAWEALQAAIPAALVQILIEKLVSLIIPAAGAVMVIIEALRAAWGTIRRILTAFSRFIRFLKAVRSGNAAGLFAEALSAAVIVIIDFVANWLLTRLRGAASAVAGRVRAIAQRITKTLRRAGQAARTAARATARGLRATARTAGRAARATGRGLRRAGQAIARTRPVRAISARTRGLRERFRAWRDRRRAGRQQRRAQRIERRLGAAEAALTARLNRGVYGWLMPLYLRYLKIRYRLTRATIEGTDERPEFLLEINPRRTLSSRAKIVEKPVGGNAVMFVMRGTPKLSARALALIAEAENIYQSLVFSMAAGNPHITPQQLGRDAGTAAEIALQAWAQGQYGFATVKIGADFPQFGGVPLGLQAPYRVSRNKMPRSFDITFPGGRLVIDFKLSPAATREDQKRVHLTYAYRKKVVLVYIYGR
jgi:Domain of unknown function (DUF4157)